MKRFAFVAVLLIQTLVAGASPDMTYDHLPDASHKLVRLGSRWVIQDAKGFFVGYYVAPRPQPVVTAPTYSRPQSRSFSNSSSSSFGSSFGSGNYGYGNYGYGYNGYGYNGYGYNGYGYNNSCRRSYNSSFGFNSGFNNCRPQPQPRPVEQPRTRAMVPVR